MSNSSKPSTKILVLISGGGSNLQAIMNACNNYQIHGDIICVISNEPTAKGLKRAEAAKIPNIIIDHRSFGTRHDFDRHLAEVINNLSPDLVVLAGFMRILSERFVNQFKGKIVNIHPSLLPAYTGLNTHQRAIDAGETSAGATVHFVTPELDGGPPILQARVPLLKNSTSTDLAKRVLEMEHIIFPKAIEWICDGRVILERGSVFKDGRVIPQPGLLFNDDSNH
jgi:phosphoribosylglycinamide formyltransferase-1